MSTAYSEASVIIPNSAGVKAGTLQAWRPDVNLLQDIDVSRPATTNVASYVNSTGVRVFVGANVPRWDWSEGGSCPSLLVEPQRTNLFDQDLAGVGIATQTVTVVNGTEYSVSVEGSGSMTLSGAGTGTVTEGSHVTFTASTTSLTLTLTGVLDYVNVEAGAYPTSIIYTSGSTATRNADEISKSGISSLIGQSEGTLYVEAKPFSDSERGYFGLSDGTTSNRVRFGFGGSGSIASAVVVGNSVQVSKTGGTYMANTYYKLAMRYKINDFKVYNNGSPVITDTSLNTFSGTTLSFLVFADSVAGGIGSFYGKIRALTWWKTALTNAELQNLTTP